VGALRPRLPCEEHSRSLSGLRFPRLRDGISPMVRDIWAALQRSFWRAPPNRFWSIRRSPECPASLRNSRARIWGLSMELAWKEYGNGHLAKAPTATIWSTRILILQKVRSGGLRSLRVGPPPDFLAQGEWIDFVASETLRDAKSALKIMRRS